MDKVDSYQRKTGFTDQFQTGTIVKRIHDEVFRVHLDHNNQRFDCFLSSDICRNGLRVSVGSRVKVKNNGFFKYIIFIFPLLCFWRSSYARRKFQLNADG